MGITKKETFSRIFPRRRKPSIKGIDYIKVGYSFFFKKSILSLAASIILLVDYEVQPGSSRQGVGTVHASSNFAASDYMSHR